MNVVSFSGGRTSAYLVYKMLELHDRKDLDFVFMDTGAEHPKTYEFVKNVARHFDINVTALRTVVNPLKGKGCTYEVVDLDGCQHDLEPWRNMIVKYGLPYVIGAFCTDRMKTTPFTKYCNDKYGKDTYITWLGIRADEPHRLKKRKPNLNYLADISPYTKQNVLDFWAKMPFDLDVEEHNGNCLFCVKKGHGKVALAMRDNPEQYKQFSDLIAPYEKNKEMYRGSKTLHDIEVEFKSVPTDDLRIKVKTNKRAEAGECTESCEIAFDF